MLRTIVLLWTAAVVSAVELPDAGAIFDQMSDALKIPYNGQFHFLNGTPPALTSNVCVVASK